MSDTCTTPTARDATADVVDPVAARRARVVAELEQGAPTLEHSLALWERGEALAARCEEWLLGAKRRLEAARTATPDESDAS